MAYDERLAGRIREEIGPDPAVTEQKMFGGLAFLVGGNMAVAASSRGGMMVHVDPIEGDRLVERGPAEPMVMRGRPISGWVHLGIEHLATKRQLTRWVGIGMAHARSLPPKPDSAPVRRSPRR